MNFFPAPEFNLEELLMRYTPQEKGTQTPVEIFRFPFKLNDAFKLAGETTTALVYPSGELAGIKAEGWFEEKNVSYLLGVLAAEPCLGYGIFCIEDSPTTLIMWVPLLGQPRSPFLWPVEEYDLRTLLTPTAENTLRYLPTQDHAFFEVSLSLRDYNKNPFTDSLQKLFLPKQQEEYPDPLPELFADTKRSWNRSRSLLTAYLPFNEELPAKKLQKITFPQYIDSIQVTGIYRFLTTDYSWLQLPALYPLLQAEPIG